MTLLQSYDLLLFPITVAQKTVHMIFQLNLSISLWELQIFP